MGGSNRDILTAAAISAGTSAAFYGLSELTSVPSLADFQGDYLSPAQAAAIEESYQLAQVGRIAGAAAIGCGAAVASGGRCGRGAAFAGGAAASAVLYVEIAGSPIDPKPGFYVEGGDGTYYPDNVTGRPPLGRAVAGFNDALNGSLSDAFKQAGGVGRSINGTPLGNAIAVLHDTWMNNIERSALGASCLQCFNFTTIPPAVAITGVGATDGLASTVIEQDRRRRRTSR